MKASVVAIIVFHLCTIKNVDNHRHITHITIRLMHSSKLYAGIADLVVAEVVNEAMGVRGKRRKVLLRRFCS